MGQDVERGTFVALEEVLSHAAERCLEAEAHLKVLAGQGSDPAFFAWSEIADNEHRLAKLLLEFARNGPIKLRETRFQYTPEETAHGRPESPEQAVAHLVNVNYRLTENLRELSTNIAPPDLGDMLDELRREVESLGQTISMISVTMRDS